MQRWVNDFIFNLSAFDESPMIPFCSGKANPILPLTNKRINWTIFFASRSPKTSKPLLELFGSLKKKEENNKFHRDSRRDERDKRAFSLLSTDDGQRIHDNHSRHRRNQRIGCAVQYI